MMWLALLVAVCFAAWAIDAVIELRQKLRIAQDIGQMQSERISNLEAEHARISAEVEGLGKLHGDA